MRTVFTAETLWDGTRLIPEPIIVVEDGRIAQLASRREAQAPAGEVRHFAGTIGPAFFDVHMHGGAGHDVMEATPEALEITGKFIAGRGTGSYLATTVTASVDATLRALEGLARLIRHRPNDPIAWPAGIHLEGPFLSHAKRGVHPPELLLEPDVALFDRMYEAAEGCVRLMTLAPELANAAELAAHATAKGVRVSMGHSDATAAETRQVMAAGATSATHTFNAMRALDHREPGILGTVLASDDLYAELICDGIHNAPELVRLWWKAKGRERGLLVTDAMSAAGMPDGTYTLGNLAVEVANGRAMVDGVLAGSVLTLDRALSNFVAFTGASVEDGLRLMTSNPAAMTGLADEAGSIAPGGPASFVAVDHRGNLLASVIRGHIAG
jgi:N-acetylglucosamine-6-phosphate deacetylase